MSNQNEKVKEHYDRVQKIYNFFWSNKKNLGMHYGFWEKGIHSLHEAIINENKKIAKRLEIQKGDLILDAGCGVGGTSIWVAENFGVNVVGITLSDNQALDAKSYANERGLGKLADYYAEDFCNTKFPDSFFNKIFAVESVCHAQKKEDFINEAFRLLKNGGKLVVADFFIVKKELTSVEKRLLDKWCYGWEMSNLPALEDFKNKLNLAGFKNIIDEDVTILIMKSSKIMFWRIGVFLGLILKLLKLFKLHSSFGGTAATRSQWQLFKKGAVAYVLFSADKY